MVLQRSEMLPTISQVVWKFFLVLAYWYWYLAMEILFNSHMH